MLANGSISAYNIQIVLIVFNRKTHVPNAYIQQLHACKDAKADWVKREKKRLTWFFEPHHIPIYSFNFSS